MSPRPGEGIAALISRFSFTYTDEADLQRQLAEVFDRHGVDYRREMAISEADRPDFLLTPYTTYPADMIALEVKVAGTPKAVRRQLARYAAHDQVVALVLVTNRVRHQGLGDEIGGKPLTVVVLPWMR